MEPNNLTEDLYELGNVLKTAKKYRDPQVFVMVCEGHNDTTDRYFEAIIIYGDNEYSAGEVINTLVKDEYWELSSLSEVGSYSEANRVVWDGIQ